MYTSVLKVLTASRNCVPLLPILAIGSENTHFDISWSSYKKSFVNTGPAPFWRLLLFNSPSVYIQTISRASLYIHQRAILCSKNLCFEISSSTVTGTKNYKTVSRRKNSVKKPFTNASRGAFRVQRTLVWNRFSYWETCCTILMKSKGSDQPSLSPSGLYILTLHEKGRTLAFILS